MDGNRIHTSEELDQITKMLINTLKNMYEEKGRNFYVKIRYLVKVTGISPHTITNLRCRLPLKVKCKTGRGSVYETVFDGKD